MDPATWVDRASFHYGQWRLQRRWRLLRELGMRIGHNVNLPMSVWVDTSHANLISIGDSCGFGDGCLILAHDAMANEFLDATRLGRVTIHDSCHFGARVVILPGVEIGPRTIVGAGSVVTRSLPPDTVAAGNPARVLCGLDEYLERHRRRLDRASRVPYTRAHLGRMSAEEREWVRRLVEAGDTYVVGGSRAMREGRSHQPLTR